MSSGDFASDIQRSVDEHLARVAGSAAEAKERIAEGVAGIRPELPPPEEFPSPEAPEGYQATRRAAVNFDDAFESALSAPNEFDGPATDDHGIPVWEDPS